MYHTPRGVYSPDMGSPITIALIDDYDVVVMGVAHILDQYRDRVTIAELDTLRDWLLTQRGHWSAMAARTGLSTKTIHRIAHRKIPTVRYSTFLILREEMLRSAS